MVVGLSKSIEGQLNSLLKRNPITGIPQSSIPQSRSAVIPLKFNAKMDGVGGIVIGNIFIVEKEKLPKGYQGEDVAFVVLGESQNITSGQDWTTEISGQLILLDNIERVVKLKNGIDPIEYGASGSPSKDPNTIAIQEIERDIATKRTEGNPEGSQIPLGAEETY